MKISQIRTSIHRFSVFKTRNKQLCVSLNSTLPEPREPLKRSSNSKNHGLYRKISPLGDPKVSIVPILDKWVEDGNTVDKQDLVFMIKELRSYKRYTHALQVSIWMMEKRFLYLTSRDHDIRLNLITRVHGIEQAENYFNSIPEKLKVYHYYALVKCYTSVKSVEKAESILQKMRDLDLINGPLTYNLMLNLYRQSGDFKKLDNLLLEMQANNIRFNKFTYGICMDAFAANSDIDRFEKMLECMESDTEVTLDWFTYASIARLYTKFGIFDKASIMLKKSEALVSYDGRRKAYDYFLTQYAASGNKDEVLRIWKLYKMKEKVYNTGYSHMIASLLKLDDIVGAEKIFEEWESHKSRYDICIPNCLIGAYSRKGQMEKAENFVNRIIEKGGKPDALTWYYMATGHILNQDMLNAVEAMKESMKAFRGSGWKTKTETLAICLDYLKREGDVKGVEEFIRLMGENDVSADVQQRLLNNINDSNISVGELITDILEEHDDDSH